MIWARNKVPRDAGKWVGELASVRVCPRNWRAHPGPVEPHVSSKHFDTPTINMSTQNDGGIEFSLVPEDSRQHFRLLELPPELLNIVTASNASPYAEHMN